MYIWIFVWLLLSTTLLYFLGWTLYILYRQKKAWRAYGQAKKLRYNPKQYFTSPDLSGVVYGYTVNLFTGEHAVAEGRGTRKLTAIEINLSTRLSFNLCVASGGMVSLARQMGFKEEIRPAHADWDKSWLASASNLAGLEAYLTPERLAALIPIMKMKNTWVIVIFRQDTALLRIDTPDPLDNTAKLDKILKLLTQTASALELKGGEDARLKSMTSKTSKIVTIKDADQPIGLELETEETPLAPPDPE